MTSDRDVFQIRRLHAGDVVPLHAALWGEPVPSLTVTCSRYDGYTLEMWSLGVTLFTLLCGENPFHDVEDTISKPLRLPAEITPSEYHIMSHHAEGST